MRSVLRGVELGALLLASASLAAAQQAPVPAETSPEAAPSEAVGARALPSATGDHDALAEARELFWQAHSHFEKGEYAKALSLFERTYALRPEPEVLFNLALTHQRLGHCDQARALYQEYQSRVQTDVTQQLGELDAQCSVVPEPASQNDTEVVPAPFAITVVQPPEAPPPPRPAAPITADARRSEPLPLKTMGWVAVGAAAVALGFAAYFETERRQYRSDYEAALDSDDENAGDVAADLADDYDRARALAVTTGVVSGVFAVTGVTLLVLAPSSPDAAGPDAGPRVGLGLRWASAF